MIDEESNIDQQFVAARAYHRNEGERYAAAVLVNQMNMMMDHSALYAATRPAYEQILGHARQALGNGHGEMAVVLAQTAAELCTELTIANLLGDRDLGELAEPLLGLVTVKDICGGRLRAVCNALAKDEIEKADFWPHLKASRRHPSATRRAARLMSLIL